MLKKFKSFVFFFAVFAIMTVVFTPEIFAQTAGSGISSIGATDTTTSFDKLVEILKILFYSGRNLVFLLSAFSLLWMAYGMATKGVIDWKNLIWFVVALVMLATVGYIIDAAVFGVASMDGIYTVNDSGVVNNSIRNEMEVMRNKVRIENIGEWQGRW